MENKAAILQSNLQTLKENSVKYNLPKSMEVKIMLFFTDQARTSVNDKEWDALFSELPPAI